MNIGTVIKHFLWILILAIHATTVWSGNDQDLNNFLIHLCCQTWQLYSTVSYQCEQLPAQADIAWDLTLKLSNGDIRTINVLKDVEYDVLPPCERPVHIAGPGSVIYEDYCVTPAYHNGSDKYFMLSIATKCGDKERRDEHNKNANLAVTVMAMGISLEMLLLLPVIFMFIAIKGLRKNVRLKLFLCYLASLVMGDLSIMPFIYHNYEPFMSELLADIILKASTFSTNLAILWTNVICYEVRYCFKQTNTGHDSKNDNKRFAWYSLYVLAMATMWQLGLSFSKATEFLSIYWLLGLLVIGILFVGMLFNVFIFIILSVEICRTRQRVSRIKVEKHFLLKTVTSIVRVFATMGIPTTIAIGVLLPLMHHISFITVVVSYITATVLDSLLIFTLFVMRPDVLNKLKIRCGCLRSQEEEITPHAV